MPAREQRPFPALRCEVGKRAFLLEGGPMALQLKNAEFYRNMAAGCEERAENARNASLKDVLKDTARSWREIAERVERQIRRKPPSLVN
jgi:hypothetical protein